MSSEKSGILEADVLLEDVKQARKELRDHSREGIRIRNEVLRAVMVEDLDSIGNGVVRQMVDYLAEGKKLNRICVMTPFDRRSEYFVLTRDVKLDFPRLRVKTFLRKLDILISSVREGVEDKNLGKTPSRLIHIRLMPKKKLSR